MENKFPRIPRNLNRSIKLQISDIEKIWELSKAGNSRRQIAREMGVSKYAIDYWLMAPEKRAETAKKNREKYKDKQDLEAKKKSIEGTVAYRKKILADEQREYLRKQALIRFNKTPERLAKSYFFHKGKIESLLQMEPLLMLLK